jgi:hypothetical protein
VGAKRSNRTWRALTLPSVVERWNRLNLQGAGGNVPEVKSGWRRFGFKQTVWRP